MHTSLSGVYTLQLPLQFTHLIHCAVQLLHVANMVALACTFATMRTAYERSSTAGASSSAGVTHLHSRSQSQRLHTCSASTT
jgi:hypothetical protein